MKPLIYAIIRWAIFGFWAYGIYTETGVWTAIFAFLVLAVIDLIGLSLILITGTIKDLSELIKGFFGSIIQRHERN